MSISGRILHGLTAAIRFAALAGGCLLLLLVCDESNAQSPKAGDTSTVQGKVERFTTAPKGEKDGAVLDNGTTLHWPPHMQDQFTDVVMQGDWVQATGRTETGPEGDKHFEVQSVTNSRTNAKAENADFVNGPAPLRPRGPDRRRPVAVNDDLSTVQGKVMQFTTGPRGEKDGAVLDDGTTLHWPPHMQDQFTDVVKEGDRVRATGRTETGPEGDRRFEIQRVTNSRTNAKAENSDFANGPLPSPAGRGIAPRRGADQEQRLRSLENQVDQLQREVDRLRRDL